MNPFLHFRLYFAHVQPLTEMRKRYAGLRCLVGKQNHNHAERIFGASPPFFEQRHRKVLLTLGFSPNPLGTKPCFRNFLPFN